jgi:hypothetical protein
MTNINKNINNHITDNINDKINDKINGDIKNECLHLTCYKVLVGTKNSRPVGFLW